jgi:flagellar motor switch protein FliN/FliY
VDELKNLDLIMDIPMEVTVELGRTRKKINDLLRIQNGSVVALQQLDGEPVDILVNKTLIARGEVVVEKEKYGIRIKEIVSRRDRLNSLR